MTAIYSLERLLLR